MTMQTKHLSICLSHLLFLILVLHRHALCTGRQLLIYYVNTFYFGCDLKLLSLNWVLYAALWRVKRPYRLVMKNSSQSPTLHFLHSRSNHFQFFYLFFHLCISSLYGYFLIFLEQWFSSGAPPEFLKHATPDCSVRGTDLFSSDSQIKNRQQPTHQQCLPWMLGLEPWTYGSYNRAALYWSRRIMKLRLIGSFLAPEILI